jgi:integrase
VTPSPKLLDQVRNVARARHLSLSTERAYAGCIRRFILFHNKKHPKEMAETEIRQFISDLAVNAKISASTQTVALSALLFLYRDVLKKPLPYVDHIERARPSQKLPVVFTRNEVQAVLSRLNGTHHLITSLLYGSGLRLMEAIRLRVKDIDFTRGEIYVRQGKGAKDRVTMLPATLVNNLMAHLDKICALHGEDLRAATGAYCSPSRSIESIRHQLANGDGNSFFPPRNCHMIRGQTRSGAITFTRTMCNGRLSGPS